jgi:hypothetical protein
MTVGERKLAVNLVKGQTTLFESLPTRKTRKAESDGQRNIEKWRQAAKRIR